MLKGVGRLNRTSLLTVLLVVGSTALFSPALTHADNTIPPTIAIQTSPPFSTVEGTILEITFAVTNPIGNPSGDLIFFSPTIPVFASGDATDIFTSVGLGSDSCIAVLAPGATCDMTFRYFSDSDIGEPDGNSGTSAGTATASDQFGNSSTISFEATVNDAPPTATPEPSSVALMGTGLSLLAIVLTKRHLGTRHSC